MNRVVTDSATGEQIIIQEEFVPYHQHLLMKVWIENPPKESSVLNEWFINLVHTVGMEVVAGPTSVYVDYPGNEGLTGTVTLATSHASIHIWDHYVPAMAQFDIYSCKCFTLEQVMECFKPWGIVKAEWVMIDRNEFPLITETGVWEN
jgi:S-adenosylmethionine/arginine decarboxylase-like enzyme